MSILSSPPAALSFDTALEPSPSSPTSTLSSDTDRELSHISQCTIPTLLGKSNFRKWHESINPILLSNDQARSLILGVWFEPPSPRSVDSPSTTSSKSPISISPTSPPPTQPYSILQAPPPSHTSFSTHQTLQHAYERGNLTVTRFIRDTLAMNVTPFVRQHTSAKGLYEQLICLYGEQAGIDMVGGPAMNIDMEMSMSLRRRRTIEPSISGIPEVHANDTSPTSQVMDTEVATIQNRQTTDASRLGYGIGINVNRNSHHTPHNISTGAPSQETPAEQPVLQKKKVAFKFANVFFPFSRSSRDKDNRNASPSSRSKTALSPTQQTPASPGTFPHLASHNHIRNPSAVASARTSPPTQVSPSLTPTALSSYPTTHAPSAVSVSSSTSRSSATPAANANTNPESNHDRHPGLSCAPRPKASTSPSEPEAGTRPETTNSGAADTNSETPMMEEGEAASEMGRTERQGDVVRNGRRMGQ